MGSTVGSLFGFAFFFSIGSMYFGGGESLTFFLLGGGIIFLPFSFITPWGFLLIPCAWYVFTALLHDLHPKPYLYFTTFYLGVFSGMASQTDLDFYWPQLSCLLPALLFLGWIYREPIHKSRAYRWVVGKWPF